MNVHSDPRPVSSLDIYWDLRTRMIAAEFRAGDKLKPEDLRQRYGCAASTILFSPPSNVSIGSYPRSSFAHRRSASE